MRRILSVAHREYMQITRSKAFWLTSLIVLLPMLVTVISGNLRNFGGGPPLGAFMLIDPEGKVTAYATEQVEIGHQRGVLYGLIGHADRWHIKPENPDAPWGRTDRFFSDAEIKKFMADGGSQTVSREVTPKLPPEAKPYHEHTRPLALAQPLAELDGVSDPEKIREILKPYLEDGQPIATPLGDRTLYMVAKIPPADTAVTQIQVWTNGRSPSDLTETVLDGYKNARMDYLLAHQGVSPETATAIHVERPGAQFIRPPQVRIDNAKINNRLVAAGVTLLLWLSLIVVGNMLLQSVMEERSNKLLEALLSSMSAKELMLGKLLGIGGVGISVVLIWLVITLLAIQFVPSDMADALRPGLISLATPGSFIAILFFFIAGYAMVAMAFLTVGSMSDTVQDAQGYLVPITTVLAVPLVLLKYAIEDPGNSFVAVASWFPPFTPYLMMARMNNDLAPATIFGTGAFLLLFIVAEFRLFSRIFATNLLRTGKPFKLKNMLKQAKALD